MITEPLYHSDGTPSHWVPDVPIEILPDFHELWDKNGDIHTVYTIGILEYNFILDKEEYRRYNFGMYTCPVCGCEECHYIRATELMVVGKSKPRARWLFPEKLMGGVYCPWCLVVWDYIRVWDDTKHRWLNPKLDEAEDKSTCTLGNTLPPSVEEHASAFPYIADNE